MRNRDDIDRFYDYGLNFTSRTIWLGGDKSPEDEDDEGAITFRVAEEFIKSLYLLESAGKDDITIIVDSTGGCCDAGTSIYDAIDTSNCYITAKIFRAESMAAMIIQAADQRIMMPNGKIMIHAGTLSLPDIHAKTAYKRIEESKKIDKLYENVLLERIREKKPKFTRSQLKELLQHDTFLNAKKAIDLGLVDEIYGLD